MLNSYSPVSTWIDLISLKYHYLHAIMSDANGNLVYDQLLGKPFGGEGGGGGGGGSITRNYNCRYVQSKSAIVIHT